MQQQDAQLVWANQCVCRAKLAALIDSNVMFNAAAALLRWDIGHHKHSVLWFMVQQLKHALSALLN